MWKTETQRAGQKKGAGEWTKESYKFTSLFQFQK